MRKILILATLPIAMALTSCKQVDITNGEIPAQYTDLAKPYMGIYSGSFEGNDGSLKLELVGKKVVATFSGKINDILGDASCESQIGNLTTIQIDDSQKVLEDAEFNFLPNRCFNIEGRSLSLNFSKNLQNLSFDAAILKQTIPYQVCNYALEMAALPGIPSPTPPMPMPIPRPIPQCHTEFQRVYFTGHFKRSASVNAL